MESAKGIGRNRNLLKEIAANKDKYILMLPYFILFTLFTVIPVISALVLSLTDFNSLEFPSFVGLRNYVKLFLDDPVFIIAIKNTLLFAAVTGPASYLLCFIMAWFVNELTAKRRTFLTFLFYAPTLSGSAYVIWKILLSGDIYGWLNGLLIRIGLSREPIYFLTDPKYMLTVIIIVQLWMSLGTSFLAFIAGLQSVDRNLYEAASIDGIKNRWQELFYVTLPSMGPQLMFGAVMQIAATFAAGQICIDLAGFPSTDYAAHTIVTHAMDYGNLRFEMGYACAVTTVLFAAMLSINRAIHNMLSKYL